MLEKSNLFGGSYHNNRLLFVQMAEAGLSSK